MKKFEGLLFCTDLDGTLFSDDRTVSKQNLDAIEYFKNEGGLFTFITGRVPQTAGHVCKTINPNVPYGCINGGGIYDHIHQKYLWCDFLHPDFTELIYEIDKQLPDIGIQYNTVDQIYFTNENIVWDFFREVTGVEGARCPFEDIKDPVLKVVCAQEDELKIAKLEKFLKSHPKADKFDFIRSEKMLFEILPKGISKGFCLAKMTELFGILPDKTIAVGDYNNDISMVKTAKHGFAVENAVPELKAVANYITVSNNENAIAKIIDMMDRGILK